MFGIKLKLIDHLFDWEDFQLESMSVLMTGGHLRSFYMTHYQN